MDTGSVNRAMAEIIARGMGHLNHREFYEAEFVKNPKTLCKYWLKEHNRFCAEPADISIKMVYRWGNRSHGMKPIWYTLHYCFRCWREVIRKQVMGYMADLVEKATWPTGLETEEAIGILIGRK